MNCDFIQESPEPNERGKYVYECPNCGLRIGLREPNAVIANQCGAKEAAPQFGPGTELKGVFDELAIEDDGCGSCLILRLYMNRIGIDGCRRERQVLAGKLAAKAKKRGWGTKLTAAAGAVTSGLAFRINPLDPYGSLIDLAVERAAVSDSP